MILKFLLVVAVIAIVYFLFIKKKPLQKNKQDKRDTPSDMVECVSCGTYVTLEDAIISDNKYYCSMECVDKL